MPGTVNYWTIVQHSGYGYGNKYEFSHGLEVRHVDTPAKKARVEKAGGLLLPSYDVASRVEQILSYPDSNPSMYPVAEGTFSTVRLDDLRIYVPTALDRAVIDGLVVSHE